MIWLRNKKIIFLIRTLLTKALMADGGLERIIVCFYFCRVSPKTLLTFCTNGVLLRTLMGNEAALSTVTHVVVVGIHLITTNLDISF